MKPIYKAQEGAVLVFSLLILLVMTVLGVAGMQSSILEEKIAGNFRDRNQAFQAVEMALRDGERWLAQLGEEPDFATRSDLGDKVWSMLALEEVMGTSNWWTKDEWYGQEVDGVLGVAESPERVIEYVKYVNDGGSLTVGMKPMTMGRVIYRITARGTGGTSSANVILQSTYAKRY